MQKLDTERLVRKLAVLDNRTVNDGVVESWHELVGHLSYQVAELALLKARQDATINWVEPKHIIGKSHDAVKELNSEAARLTREAEENGASDPQPKCLAHGLLITSCAECCVTIYNKSWTMPEDRLHLWAVANVYEEVAL
jgi:hypothetical protein